jgi:hypothetical protein
MAVQKAKLVKPAAKVRRSQFMPLRPRYNRGTGVISVIVSSLVSELVRASASRCRERAPELRDPESSFDINSAHNSKIKQQLIGYCRVQALATAAKGISSSFGSQNDVFYLPLHMANSLLHLTATDSLIVTLCVAIASGVDPS